MATGSTLPAIEKLKGRENFESWKFSVQAYLELEGLWDCVSGKETDAKKIVKAKSKLILLVDPVNFVHIQTAKTAKEVWESLKGAFEDSGLTRRVGLLRTLTTTKLENCNSVEEYVNKIIMTAHKLRNVRMDIDDEWVGTLLLAGLPDEYKPMIMGIESSGVDISSDLVKTKLLQDVKSNLEPGGDSVAMFGKKFRKRRPMKCFECHKEGHFVKDCPLKLKKRSERSNYISFAVSNLCTKEWYVDSGASAHMTQQYDWIRNPIESSNCEVVVADSTRLPVKCTGEVNLKLTEGDKTTVVNMKDVLCVPSLRANLLSVSQMTRNGNTVKFDSTGCKVYDGKNELIATASLTSGMYKLNQAMLHSGFAVDVTNTQELWHRRFGHIGFDNLKRLANGLVDGVRYEQVSNGPCVMCLKGKQRRLPLNNVGTRATKLLELVHSDVCGPMSVDLLGGARYFLTFLVRVFGAKQWCTSRKKRGRSLIRSQKSA